MSIESAIHKYFEAILTDTFIRYEKEFAQRICRALNEGYLQNKYESSLVQAVEDVVNSINDFTSRDDRVFFNLSTKSVFIHGNKSQVEFDYYGQNTKRELGDLIFIISIVFNGQKYFEKLTINQFKNEKKGLKALSWDLGNKEQLYLLSRFPTFTGTTKSIFPLKKYSLPNYSGCLGSYGLLHRPGDLVFISATELDSFQKNKEILKIDDLHELSSHAGKYAFPYFPFLSHHLDELFFFEDICRHYKIFPGWPWLPFGNAHFAGNVFDFSHKYLTMSLGEPIFMKNGLDNPHARNLLIDLFSSIKAKARREMISESLKLAKFIDSFFAHSYSTNEKEGYFNENKFDFKEGGIGIIHTILDLGE